MTRKTHIEKPAKTASAPVSVDEPSTVDGRVDALRSEGQRLLLAVPASLAAIAGACEASKAIASKWRRGESTPAAGFRARLHTVYGIDPGAWDRAPAGEHSPSAKVVALPTREPAAHPTTLDEVNALLASKEVRLDDRIRLLGIKARLEKETQLLEDRIVREHPAFRRATARLLEVLKKFPAAAREVAEALRELGL